MNEARQALLQRWPAWRSLSHLAWWSIGIAPFSCLSLLLCLIGASPPEGDSFPWHLLGVAGGVGLVVTVLSVVVWLRRRQRGVPGLLQSLLLALPPSYFPTLVLSLWVQRLPLEQLLVPKTLALWGTIYVAWVIAIYLLRQHELGLLTGLEAAAGLEAGESPTHAEPSDSEPPEAS